MTTDKEQRLAFYAEKHASKFYDSEENNIEWLNAKRDFISGAKSDFSREYWQSQQQETPELEEIKSMVRKSVNEHLVKHKDVGHDTRCRVDIMIEEIANNLAPYIKGTEWVSVKDRLPDEGQLVLSIGENPVPRMCIFENGMFSRAADITEYDRLIHIWYDKIKLWVELPKAPKEVANNEG